MKGSSGTSHPQRLMKEHDYPGSLPGPKMDGSKGRSRNKRHHWCRGVGAVLFVLVVVIAVGRAVLPSVVRDYVNRTLDRNLLYEGRIGDVDIHLLHGAYSIRDVHISQRTGNVPVPLLVAKAVDFSIQWSALLRGRIVGQFVMQEPELNFVA